MHYLCGRRIDIEITIKFTNEAARRTEYFLQLRYKSKAKLSKLAKVAILREAAQSAQSDLRRIDEEDTATQGQ